MRNGQTTDIAIEHGLVAALIAFAAVAAANASYLVVAGLCFAGSFVYCRRLGRLIEVRLDARKGWNG